MKINNLIRGLFLRKVKKEVYIYEYELFKKLNKY